VGYISFYRWTPRRPHSVGITVSNSDGEWVMSLYGDLGLNPSVIPSLKSSKKIHVIKLLFFFKNLYISSEIRSVTTDGINLPVHTDRIADGLQVVGNDYRQQHSIGIDRRNLHRR
jgi:hypothetical protein